MTDHGTNKLLEACCWKWLTYKRNHHSQPHNFWAREWGCFMESGALAVLGSESTINPLKQKVLWNARRHGLMYDPPQTQNRYVKYSIESSHKFKKNNFHRNNRARKCCLLDSSFGSLMGVGGIVDAVFTLTMRGNVRRMWQKYYSPFFKRSHWSQRH